MAIDHANDYITLRINKNFKYHKPQPDQVKRYTAIRDTAREFAALLNCFCPGGDEKNTAIMKLEECVMWANAAIARGEAE